MEQYEINVMRSAQSDVYRIVSYIKNDLDMPNSAADHESKFNQAIKSLSESPERYPFVLHDELRTAGYRRILVKNYIVFYLVDDVKKVVEIMRVLHASRNWAEILDQRSDLCLI